MDKSVLKAAPEDFLPGGLYDGRSLGLDINPVTKKVGIRIEIPREGKSSVILIKEDKIVEKKDGSWNPNSQLGRDIQAIQGYPLTEKQLTDGISDEDTKDKQCKILVVRQNTSGGKLKSVITAVLPANAS